VATATVERVTLSREIAGVGRLDFEQTEKRRDYWLLPEGNARRVRLPSVTTILGDTWSDRGLLEWYMREPNARAVRDESAERGKDVHHFVETFMREGVLLPFADFAPDRRPYLQGAARFLFERNPIAVNEGVERLVCHPELRYAGRLDLLAVCNDSPALTILDFKSNPQGNIYAKAHVQLLGYAVADRRCGGELIERATVVGLTEQGTYRLVETPMTEAADTWASALAHYTQIKGLLKTLGERG
jgi:hypothetical protein